MHYSMLPFLDVLLFLLLLVGVCFFQIVFLESDSLPPRLRYQQVESHERRDFSEKERGTRSSRSRLLSDA